MSIVSKIFTSMNEDLPKFQSLDEGIDFLMKYIKDFSEDLWEKEFYVNKRWKEVRDDVNFQESILHIFEEDGKYLRILDGDIATGAWEYTLGGIVLKLGNQHELYERVFLNEKFFILKKHGEHSAKGNRRSKYFFITIESLANKLEWTDQLVVMYEIYKSNTNYLFLVLLFFAIIAVILFFSIM